MTSLRERAIQLYDRYTHDHLDRRRLLREMTALAGSAAAAEVLIGAIAPSAAAAAVVAPDDKRLKTYSTGPGADGQGLGGYHAELKRGARKRVMVLVIHENRGLNDHIRDVARRVALAGFPAFAPDYLSGMGGTPADADRARGMIGELDLGRMVARTAFMIRTTNEAFEGRLRFGAVGFCWGGAFVNRLAVEAGPALAAGVSYYGPAPAPSEAAKVEAAMMVHLAGNDQRVNATGLPWIEALRAAGKRVEGHVYPGVAHAFNNDTSAERYDGAAADLAWGRTTAFLGRELDA